MEIISLTEAKVLNLKYYFTGKSCKHDHVCERKVIDRSCVECNKIKSKKFSHKATEWYYHNKEAAQDTRKAYYENNKDAFKARARKWEKDNPERLAELQRNWRRTEKGKAQSRNWVANNAETHAAYVKDWKNRNLNLVYEYTGTRRAAKLQATPPWLSQQDRIEIRAFYAEAKRLEAETGIPHNVDHIIPLQHPFVRGLHVPWNLQILTESANASKGNYFE